MTTAGGSPRCATCARFVRIREVIDDNGEVNRAGECLLNVWSPPIYETMTCSQHVERGTFRASAKKAESPSRRGGNTGRTSLPTLPVRLDLPADLLTMDADEFRDVLRQVIREELTLSNPELAARWRGGELVLRPGKEGTAEKRIPIETLFTKIVAVRDRLRVLEQKLNTNAVIPAEEKLNLQQYITQCYGSLTTFNLLFSDRDDTFIGQKGQKEDS